MIDDEIIREMEDNPLFYIAFYMFELNENLKKILKEKKNANKIRDN